MDLLSWLSSHGHLVCSILIQYTSKFPSSTHSTKSNTVSGLYVHCMRYVPQVNTATVVAPPLDTGCTGLDVLQHASS